MVDRTKGMDIDQYIKQLQSTPEPLTEKKRDAKEDSHEMQRRLSTGSNEELEQAPIAQPKKIDSEKLSKFVTLIKNQI